MGRPRARRDADRHGQRFELWDKARHDAHEANVLAAGMPDALRDMVL